MSTPAQSPPPPPSGAAEEKPPDVSAAFWLSRDDVMALETVHANVVAEWKRQGAPGDQPTRDETSYQCFRVGLREFVRELTKKKTDAAPPGARRRARR